MDRKVGYEHAGKIEAQLQAEAAELMTKAEAADQADVPDGMSIPEELGGVKQAITLSAGSYVTGK